MKIKLIKSFYNKKTGISVAIINTDYGIFKGYSKLHEEDRDIVSNFAGCQYAHTRAIVKYMKKRVEVLSSQIKGLKDYQKVLQGKVSYNHNSMESRTLRKRIFILEAQKKNWQSKIKSLSEKNLKAMMERRETIKKFTNKRGEE